MGRIRSIKPEFWTSEQIAECSPNARLMFIGLWNFCDDYGRHPASPKRLKMEVFPADSIEVRPLMAELVAANLVDEYEWEGQSYWQVTGWAKHQKIDSPTSRYPDKFGEYSPTIRRTFGGRSPLEKEKEKEKEKEGIKLPAAAARPTLAEVRQYCLDRHNSVDPETWFDHYTANGWKVGKNPMKDWRAAVRTWEKQQANGASGPRIIGGKDYTIHKLAGG